MDWTTEANANYSVWQQTNPFYYVLLMFSLGLEFSVIADLLCDILQEMFRLLWREHNKA